MKQPTRYRVHRIIDGVVPFVVVLVGMLHPSPAIWYTSFALCFAVLAGFVLTGAGLSLWAARHVGTRIQGPRRRPAPIRKEALETALAMWVFAALAAWPLTQYRVGASMGLVFDPAEVGLSVCQVVGMTLAGILVLDAWLYWKHRLLHTRALFGFHRQHHVFRDPTPFAGFAVGPVESLLTFWPILLVCIPAFVHWAPLYLGAVLGFVILNFYLHCGVTLKPLEATLPRAMVNTSAHHNIHHSHASVHFGEAMTIWDALCRTRLEDRPGTQPVGGA